MSHVMHMLNSARTQPNEKSCGNRNNINDNRKTKSDTALSYNKCHKYVCNKKTTTI